VIAIVCDWGGDLSIGPSGDIAVAPAHVEINQRIVRRLLTNPGDYIWHTDYGAGLGKYVGEPYSPELVEGTILNQLRYESLIASSPLPLVQTDELLQGTFIGASVTIKFQVADTGVPSFVALNPGT
jgi:hypothetical protein